MIYVEISTESNGYLRSIEATGHAFAGSFGSDIVCSAVTAILRTAARLLENNERYRISGGATVPGLLKVIVDGRTGGEDDYLRGVGDFVIYGISAIANEYPDRCSVTILERSD